MDEQRIQAYLSLIQELFTCPSGEEGRILGQHSDLIDEGFFLVGAQLAQQLQEAGQEQKARFLVELLAQLIGSETPTSGSEPRILQESGVLGSRATPQEYEQFLVEVLQAVSDSNVNPRVVYPLLANNLTKLNATFLETIQIFVQNNGTQNTVIDLFNFGSLIQQFPLGQRDLNLEIAITIYNIALDFFPQATSATAWATIQNNLGEAYRNRIRGERAENLENAIAAYEQALQVYTREAFPQDWAMTQNNLAIAYSDRIRGERAENLERAIAAYEQALQVYTREAFPEDWAMTQNNLANAYSNRIRGERAENLENAIAAYEQALLEYTREAFPEKWATTQNNLAVAYSNRIRGERAENLENAIAAYEQALQVRTREAFPEKWAMTQNNLGEAYRNRIRGERAENLENAIAAYEQALLEYTREAFPEDWATTQNNLGNAYLYRIRGERAENLENAIAAYEQALLEYTREAFPEDWATTQNNLAVAYSDRIRGEKAENLENAIRLYQEALTIRTRQAFPQNYTETLNNLGFAYQDLSRHYSNNPEQKQKALENAYNTFAQALNTVEYLRGEIVSGDETKRKLNEEWNKLYKGIVQVSLELGNHNSALEYIDRSKARNLVEEIAIRETHPNGIPPEIPQQLQHLRNAIAQENQRLSQDKNPDYSHIDQLRQDYQKLAPYHPLQFQQMQALLDEETVILEWYILGDTFLAFTLTAQSLRFWQSSPEDRKNLIDWTKNYYTDYYTNKTQWRNSLAQRLATLADILHLNDRINDLFQHFPHCKRLILIPHRFLHLFPLHALPVTRTDPNSKEDQTTQSLQDWFSNGVNYAPNCQLLRQAQNRHRPHFDRLFAIQNPTEDLAFATLEVETIGNSFNSEQSTILAHKKATKSALFINNNKQQLREDLAQTHHLYFSCHGAFNLTTALNSGLQLADEVLTLTEIITSFNLSHCSLVTLSACETGQVALDETDEYTSLSSGFILAGSPSVLVSQWSVDQTSTALLLIKTYELLQKHPGQYAICLKNAQNWLRTTTVADFQDWTQKCPLFSNVWREALKVYFENMENERGTNDSPYESPYYWAAFCMVGVGEQKMIDNTTKLQAFLDLVRDNPNDLFADHWQSLNIIIRQFTEDEDHNIKMLKTWLQDETRAAINQAFQTKISPASLLVNAAGEKGGFGSQKTQKSKNSWQEQYEQAIKKNTPDPDRQNQSSNDQNN